MTARRKAPLLALLLVGFASPGAAWAQPSPDQKAAAQALFDQARTLVEQNHFADACPKFLESQKLDPGLGTMLWLADCYENNGQTASAWATFKEAAAVAARNHDDREKVATDRAHALEATLSKLMIVVPPDAAAAGPVLQRDGVDLSPAEWGVALPVDPGVHSVGASAPGRVPWSTTVQLPARAGTVQVTVPVLEAAAAPVPAAQPVSQGAAPPPAAAVDAHESKPGASASTQRAFGLAAAGFGIVALGVGTYFALHAKSTYDGASVCVGGACDANGRQERNDAFTQATVATVALGVGAAALAGGALLYFLVPRSADPAAVAVAPSPHGASVVGTWRW